MDADRIAPQRCYSNGAYGRAWGVRMVTEIAVDPASGERTVQYRGMAGACRRKTGTVSVKEFAAWSKYEVALNENSWQRVGPAGPED